MGAAIALLLIIVLSFFALQYNILAAPDGSNVIFSEVEYNPSAQENEAEWFELYNPTESDIDISGWTVEENGGYSYTFNSPTVVPAGGYLLVVNETNNFLQEHPGVTPDVDMAGAGCYSDTECLRLNNSGVDGLTLYDGATEVDAMTWGSGAFATAGNGNSVCRNTSTDTGSGNDWNSNCSPTPGSGSLVQITNPDPDSDNDGIADSADLDIDNDGIINDDEFYCNESSQTIAGSGQYKSSLHFFDWSGLNINANDMTGNTVFETSFVEKGITYKAEIQNVNRSGNDAITATDMGGGYAPSYSISSYNPAGSTEAIKTTFPNVGSVNYDIKFSAERNGISYPVKIAVFDAQVTNHDFGGWKESIAFATNGTNFKLLEEIGGDPNSNAITGIDSQTITYLNTRPDDNSIPNRNAIFTSRGTDLKINTEARMIMQGGPVSSQAMTYAVVLNCDTDNDGTPNYLDLDSDNDGCFDALEGGGNVNQSSLNADGSINDSVNGSGLPNLVGAGQTIGNSAIATMLGIDTPLTDRNYQIGQAISLSTTDAYYRNTNTFNNGVPDYTGTIKQNTGLNYQWQVSTDNGTTFSDITNATSASLNLTGTANIDGNIYRLMVNCDSRVCSEELTRSKLTLINSAPVAADSSITVDEESTGTSLGTAAPTDADNDSLTITVTNLPTLGVIKKADGTIINNGDILTIAELTGLVYDAPDEYNGTDSVGDFNYSVSDGTKTSNGEVDININPINDTPNLQNDANTTIANVAVSGNVITTADTDTENDNLNAVTTPVSGPSHGLITINADGSYTYTPDNNYTGNDQVEIRICDDGSPTPACANQLLDITINSNDSPVITTHNDTIIKGDNFDLMTLLDNATDTEDGDITTNVTISNDGGFDKDTAGTYTITFSVTDSHGNTTTQTATIEVQYTNVFDPPSARKTVTGAVAEMEWKMVWINDGNAVALNTQVLDNIPTDTTYVENSLTCEARGASTTAVCTYDVTENRVRWEGDIAPDMGGTNEVDSANEVVITFKTSVPTTVNTVENQAMAYYDQDGDGDFNNDKTNGLTAVLTVNNTGNVAATVWNRTTTIDSVLLPNTGFVKNNLQYLALISLIPIIFLIKKRS